MTDGLTVLGGAVVGSVLTFMWQKAADRRKDKGVRRQLRGMLRVLLQRCVSQTVGGPHPPFKLVEYAELVDALRERATKDDVPTAFSDRQSDALQEAVQQSALMKRRAAEYYAQQGFADHAWMRLPEYFRSGQDAEIAALAFALIVLGDDAYVDSQVPDSIKNGETWKIYVDQAFAIYRLPSPIYRLAHWGARKNRWRGYSLQVAPDGRYIPPKPLPPAAERLRRWFEGSRR